MLYAIALANEIEILVKSENSHVIRDIIESGKKVNKVVSEVQSCVFKSVKEVTIIKANPETSYKFSKD